MYVMRSNMKKLQDKKSGSSNKQTPEPVQPAVIQVPKGELVLIKDRCKSCGFCIEFCPKQVLEFSSESNAKGYRVPRAKDPDKCILCGFCSMYCPDFAIYQIRQAHCKQVKKDKAEKKQ